MVQIGHLVYKLIYYISINKKLIYILYYLFLLINKINNMTDTSMCETINAEIEHLLRERDEMQNKIYGLNARIDILVKKIIYIFIYIFF